MVPAEASWLMTRMAPAQTMAICRPRRQRLGGGGERPGDGAAALDAVERLGLGGAPAAGDGGEHAHRDDDLGVADRGGGLGVDGAGGEVGAGGRAADEDFGGDAGGRRGAPAPTRPMMP